MRNGHVKSRMDRRGFRGLVLLAMLALAGAAEVSAQEQAQEEPLPTPLIDEVAAAAAAEALFGRLDSDHDGQLSLEEFRAVMPSRRQGVVYQRLSAHFRNRDTDQSGFLEAGEFAALLLIINAGSDAPTMESADSNADARLDFREYALLMARLDGALP